MSGRSLLAIPAAVAVAYLVASALIRGEDAQRWFFAVDPELLKLAAAGGCLTAASRYRRGEYLGVAWLLLGLDYSLLFLKDLLFGRVLNLASMTEATNGTLRAIVDSVANGLAAVSSVMMARAWSVAGIALPGSRRSQRLLLGLAITVAVAIVGWGTLNQLPGLRAGNREVIASVISSVGDIVCFSVIAPLLLTAIAMRGGALAWPWALLTASNFAWLLYDVAWSFQPQWHLEPTTLRTIAELWRAVACALVLAAGLAQRWTVRSFARS